MLTGQSLSNSWDWDSLVGAGSSHCLTGQVYFPKPLTVLFSWTTILYFLHSRESPNTSFPIFALSSWPCLLVPWRKKKNQKRTSMSSRFCLNLHLPTGIWAHRACLLSCYQEQTVWVPVCASILLVFTKSQVLLNIQKHCSFHSLESSFSLRSFHPHTNMAYMSHLLTSNYKFYLFINLFTYLIAFITILRLGLIL